ncbi:alpha/beta hydrolase [Myxococcota bacterium]|nr:alpha/beta hydrolase [Myxococcota bacterium]MBU1380253.1 alpha/beta hydrolase [Myxococcota bacterium]MBU1496367.1 alpha/beta hydrolase [Myxococcota bacterium]
MIKKSFLQTGKLRTAHLSGGSGDPILFIHSIPGTSFLWMDHLEAFASTFFCFAPDIYGCGDTTGPSDSEYDLETLSDSIYRYSTTLGISSTHVVAHGNGAAAALILALQKPGFLKSLILINPMFGSNIPGKLNRTLMILAKRQSLWDAGFHTGLIPGMIRLHTKAPHQREKSRVYTGEILRPFENSTAARARFQKVLKDFNPKLTKTLCPHLHRIQVPVGLVTGSEDHVCTPDWLLDFSKLFNSPKWEVINGGSHFLPLEAPAQLTDFINSVINQTAS